MNTCFEKERRENPLILFLTTLHLLSRILGDGIGWCTVNLQGRPGWRNSFLQSFHFISFHWGRFPRSAIFILLVLVARQGQKWLVHGLSAFGPLIDRLLNRSLREKKEKSRCGVPSVCKLLCVNRFPGFSAWSLCFSHLLRNVHSEHV